MQEEGISDEDYAHAQKVWDVFHCNTFGEYHDLYLKTDVLLLADVFENFINVCLTTYELGPTHYYTAPGLSWDAMLKHTQVQLELIDDIDIYQMVEKGIRGGISVITHKYANANNPYVPGYDASNDLSRINDLSEYSQKLRKDLGLKGKPNKKLVLNLDKKEKYVVHYRNLQQYVSHGLKPTKVHRAIMSQQNKWLAEYTALITKKRKAAKTSLN